MPDKRGRKAFEDRGFKIEPFPLRLRRAEELAATDSVVISQRATDLKGIFRDLERMAATLLEYDCRVYVRVASGQDWQGRERTTVVNAIRRLRLPGAGIHRDEHQSMPEECREREGSFLAPYVYVCQSSQSWESIAQLIAQNPAGEGPNLRLTPDVMPSHGRKKKLDKESVMLVRRAFSDCEEVHLQPMLDGLSGVTVYRAYAKLEAGAEGRWPASYFVKIGGRKKISTEYFKYQNHALKYIPFNLAPRLMLDRCALGARKGIIVGDFVEQSESLRDAARAGRAAHAIGTLFSRTLAPWRNAHREDKRTVWQALSYMLSERDIPLSRKTLIRGMGGDPDVAAVRQSLDRCTGVPTLVGTIHGDLNASNVLIRLSDAILIDFEQLEVGMPLLYDAASVEAGLFVDGFLTDRRSIASLLESIECLYDDCEMFDQKNSCHPRDGSSWYFDCVRQVRLHAKQMELKTGQYATALAIAFVKKACNPEPFKGRREELRAAAFILGEKILRQTVAVCAKETK